MYRPLLIATGLGWGLLLLLASTLASSVFAWQHGYAAVLGAPLAQRGAWALYSPLAIWQWAWHWGWQAPAHFQLAGLLGGGLMLLGGLYARASAAPQDGVARWATTADLREAGLYAPRGVVLGTRHGRVLRYDGPAHTLVIAPTRSGKTTSTGVPTCYAWEEDSLVLHDPKEELYATTAGFRARMSLVRHLNPTSKTSHCYNPLAEIRLGTVHEIRDVSLLTSILQNPDGEPVRDDSVQHFGELTMDIHNGALLHGLYTHQAMTLRALDDLYMSEATFELLLKDMERTRHTRAGCHPAVRRAVRILNRLADRELSGVQSTVSRGLRLYLDPLVARMTSRSDFTLKDLRERTRPMTLYLSVPYSDQERLRPLSRLLLRQLLGYTTQRLGGWRHRLLLLIDEVQALNKMAALSEALNYAAGYGVNCCFITPSLNELERLYGPKHNFLEGCHIRVAYAPNDFQVARRLGEQAGETDVERQRQSWSSDVGTLLGRRTTSTETAREPLQSPTAMMQMHPEEVLLLVGNTPPARLTKARFWRRRRWRRWSRLPAPLEGKDAA